MINFTHFCIINPLHFLKCKELSLFNGNIFSPKHFYTLSAQQRYLNFQPLTYFLYSASFISWLAKSASQRNTILQNFSLFGNIRYRVSHCHWLGHPTNDVVWITRNNWHKRTKPKFVWFINWRNSQTLSKITIYKNKKSES